MEQIEINGLLWDKKNTQFGFKKYFSVKDAINEAKIRGKRLPTLTEFEELLRLGYKMDKDKGGFWVADQKLFFPVIGYIDKEYGNRMDAPLSFYLTSSRSRDTDVFMISLGNNSGMYGSSSVNICNEEEICGCLRLVQDKKQDNECGKVETYLTSDYEDDTIDKILKILNTIEDNIKYLNIIINGYRKIGE